MSIRAFALMVGVAVTSAIADPPAPTFRLFLLGHEIGAESDAIVVTVTGQATSERGPNDHLVCDFHFVDRGTPIDLAGVFEPWPSPRHLSVKGRNYRLFTSDSEVTIAAGRAHIRDLTTERDIDLGGKPFFPIDNYAPIGVQEELIKYWLAQGQPAALASAPSGPLHVSKRGVDVVHGRPLDRYAIEGVVWGTEAAWVDPAAGQLVALTTWAGALPFEAVRDGWQSSIDEFIGKAVTDRIADLVALTRATSPLGGGSFALVGARVIEGTSRPPLDRATVVVRDGRIAAVGPSTSTPVPRDVAVVDVTGKTILAGLWDMHAHAGQVDWSPAYLASGVTTIRDMGGEERFLAAIRDAIDAGAALGPRYLVAGLVDGPGAHAFGAVTAATPSEAVAIVRRYHDEHFQEIKIYTDVAADVVQAIVSEAHRLGMTVTGHVPTALRTAQAAVDAGFDGIAHMQLRGASGSEVSKAQIAFFRAHRTVMDPTESWNELSGRPTSVPFDTFLPGMDRLPLPLARMFASMPGAAGDPASAHARLVDSLKLLKDAVDAGLLVVAGTDKGVPGLSLPREIELYVEGGMTPLQAIQTATIMPARVMHLESEVGTVEVGKRADLIVLDRNPLEAIANIRSVSAVVTQGRLYSASALWTAAGFKAR
jgi:imidazolonepropionase-like amidohydrolase